MWIFPENAGGSEPSPNEIPCCLAKTFQQTSRVVFRGQLLPKLNGGNQAQVSRHDFGHPPMCWWLRGPECLPRPRGLWGELWVTLSGVVKDCLDGPQHISRIRKG